MHYNDRVPMSIATQRKEPADPYQYNTEDVQTPPATILSALRRIGPGMILAASIVGSGELIATTTLGAQVGYTALWVILLSCFIKPVVQGEFGRYTIVSGETGLEAFNHVPGPRWKVNWIVWCWAFMVSITLLQVGAMFGGVSQVMNLLFPAIAVNWWVLFFLGLTLAILLGGGYERIEGLATLKVALFTMLTFLCAMLLFRRPEFYSWDQIVEGLKLQMPGDGLSTAVAVFGITGVGATELVMYPYWCVEKGYARFTGKDDHSADWKARARGWVRVMQLDITCSMIIYTVATIAFYMLGAGVLNSMGLRPGAKEAEMISVLSNIYTQILGRWSLALFYIGAIATLYGTIFAATASHSRVFADFVRLLGGFARDDYRSRVRYRRFFVVLLTVVPALLYLFVQAPVKMVVLGGKAQAMMLPILAGTAIYLRYQRLPRKMAPGLLVSAALWICGALMFAAVGYAIFLAG